MERKRRAAKPSPPRPSPDKTKRTTGGVLERLHGPSTFSLRALVRSFFSCSGAGGECTEDEGSHNENVIKRPVVSPTRPYGAKKQKRAKHAPSQTLQVPHGSAIQLSTVSKKWKADDNGKDSQIVTDNNLLNTEKQEIRKQEPPLPNISEPSTILSESLRSSLCTHLPTLVRGREWVLLYSTWKHGISLRTLYRGSSHLSGPCLLAVEDSKGAVFGGLLTGPLNPTAKQKFQGTHESFVFTNADNKFGLFHSTGLNRYYFLCTNDMLAVGGGAASALRLDGDLLHGSSGLSETFGNGCLSYTEEFDIKHVELWGFAHKSTYVPEKAVLPEESPGVWRW